MIDIESIANTAMEITKLYRKINSLFPKENQAILKHLAASSIHMALFMDDLNSIINNQKSSNNDKIIDKFLDECGCKFNE